ncbi:PilW family protein [Acinetobacter rathckeae]|uniref:PilW family protein n=1 Tax=Acinetobacter rathckeae TaxID=2605272 RepID=UPI0018A287A0|nr:PilW family protein [Acinetobacter rathckeae]MBF7688400.1 PilW family protein [Acinetobacter rathckeae]MBF7695485.1 PilW family protein [Acinetobacter rathckeae]
MYMQKGFTMVELMVALLLGTMISSIALMLFLSGQRSQALQQATAEIQDGSNFSLEYMVRNIRKSNFSGSGTTVNNDSANGGIVLSGKNLVGVSSDLVTLNEATKSASNHIDVVNSDQLTIQYFVSQDQVNQRFFDCTGQQVTESRYVVERYFVRQNGGLVCASNRGGNVNSLASNAQLIMPGVDYLRVLLSVQRSSDSALNDVAINQYNGVDNIVGVKLGILLRSNQTVGTNIALNQGQSVRVLDRTVQLSDLTTDKQTNNLRVVLEQTVALRNAIGGGL